jgi:hypothetical protein
LQSSAEMLRGEYHKAFTLPTDWAYFRLLFRNPMVSGSLVIQPDTLAYCDTHRVEAPDD